MVGVLVFIKLLVHLITAGNYGLFIDELYFLACGQHLAWGYVDMPPLTAVLAWVAQTLFSHSIAGIHLIPAVAGAGLVLLTGLLVYELGGKAYAQLLAGISVIIAGFFLSLHSYLSMNAIEPLIWLGCALLLVHLDKTGNTRLWIGFGLLCGIGLMNKDTMLMFGFAILVGLFLTPARKYILNRWFWLGGAIALLIFLPNLVWLVQHQFPMVELLANIQQSGRNVQLNPAQFLWDEIFFMQPLTLPVWAAGIGWYFIHPEGKRFRFLGWAFILCLAILLVTDGRTYYLAPAFPILLAAGAVFLGKAFTATKIRLLEPAYVLVLSIGGILTAPLFLPVLQPETYIKYTRALGLRPPRIETFQESQLPQLFADRFGWPEMAQKVADVYQSLSPEERSEAVVLTGNYGQAGAIDFYGPQWGLPQAISGHQNYYYWGTRGYTGEVVIALGIRPDDLKKVYNSVIFATATQHPYAMIYEKTPIYVCRQPKVPLTEVWSQFKHWE